MTVQSIEADITYTFNDEGQYPFAFDILKPKDVTVQFIDNLGVRHVLAMGTDYLVVDNVGSRYIEIISTCGFIGQSGQLFIFRDMPVEQPTDWVNNEELDMELLEKSFDRVIMILQQFNTQMTSELAAITWRAGWQTGAVYKARDMVQAPNSNIYLATRGHTAGVFETDLLTGYWNLVIDIAEIAGYAEVADKLVLYDENGTAKFGAPTDPEHPVRLGDTDTAAAADTLVLRDANGTAKFGAPTDPEHPMRLGDISLRENVKVTVGAGGDFPTINAAVLHLSRFTPDLGVTAEVELMSGFVMEEQLFVEGLDLGWITITGVDAETVINEPSLTRVLGEGHKPAFVVINGTLPTIGQLFNFSSKGDPADRRPGVMAHSLGRATVLPGCGVRNAGTYGIFATTGSTINAQGANVSGAGENGIYASSGSTINAQGANVSGAGAFGLYVSTNSTVNAHSANASGAGTYGIFAGTGATISAHGASGTLSQAKNTVTAAGIIFQP